VLSIYARYAEETAEGELLPVPRVEKGKWSKERERTKSGRWRKKRSDADKQREKPSRLKYWLAALAVIAVVVVFIVVFFFPQLLGLKPIQFPFKF